jgi:DHA2 family methylenomycin A resistance protein-like MFS transporter
MTPPSPDTLAASAGSSRSRRPGPPGHWPQTATLIATSLGFGVIQLDVTVVNVAVKQIGASFGGGITGLQWVVSAYTLVLAALILTAGALGDRLGAKRMLCTGFVVFTVASVLCGLSVSMAMLIAARAVQGAGAALLGSCALALLNHSYADPGERTRAVGRFVAGASAALSGGPVVGGLLIAAFGWRAIFFINVPLGAVGCWLALRYAAETDRSAARRVDTAGAALATVALAGFAASVIEAGSFGFASPWVLGGLGCALAAAVGFVAVEARAAAPMLPLSLFRRPGFVAPVTIGFLVNVCFYGLIFLFSLLFQAQHRMSALSTGLAFLPMTAAILGANLISGRVTAAIGSSRAILAGLTALTAGCAGLLWASPHTGYLAMLGQQILLGGGLGTLVPPMTSVLLASADRSRSGVTAGALTAFRQAGSLLGVALFGSLAATDFYGGFRTSLIISVVILIVSAGVVVGAGAVDHG